MRIVYLKTDQLEEGRAPDAAFVVSTCIRLPIWTGVLIYKSRAVHTKNFVRCKSQPYYKHKHQEGNCRASIFALGCRPSINSERTSPVPGACDMPQAPWPAAIYTPPCAPTLVFIPPSFSSGILDTIGRPLDFAGLPNARAGWVEAAAACEAAVRGLRSPSAGCQAPG